MDVVKEDVKLVAVGGEDAGRVGKIEKKPTEK